MALSKKDLFKNTKNIAVIGCSVKPYRTSHHIAKYLQGQGFNVIPINPNYDEILGQNVYPTLQDVPADIDIHIADIFRNKQFTDKMVEQIVNRVEATGFNTAVWTQLEVSSAKAKKRAEEAGLMYIENECIMVEHQRLFK